MEPPTPTRLSALALRLVRLVTDRARAELVAAGFGDVRPAHNLVLAQVTLGNGLRVTDLAERAGVTKQAVTLMVDHLEAAGYVTRVPDPNDRRAKQVVATERGAAAAAVSLRVAEEIEAAWRSRIGADRLAGVKQALADGIAELEGHVSPDPSPSGPAPKGEH